MLDTHFAKKPLLGLAKWDWRMQKANHLVNENPIPTFCTLTQVQWYYSMLWGNYSVSSPPLLFPHFSTSRSTPLIISVSTFFSKKFSFTSFMRFFLGLGRVSWHCDNKALFRSTKMLAGQGSWWSGRDKALAPFNSTMMLARQGFWLLVAAPEYRQLYR